MSHDWVIDIGLLRDNLELIGMTVRPRGGSELLPVRHHSRAKPAISADRIEELCLGDGYDGEPR